MTLTKLDKLKLLAHALYLNSYMRIFNSKPLAWYAISPDMKKYWIRQAKQVLKANPKIKRLIE